MAPGEDRISQLPPDILDHILGFLPIQEAAKTAVLSPIWRDVWSRLTQLNFDYHFSNHVSNKHRHASKYVRKSAAGLYVINKVLLQHNGNIRKFVLDLSDVGKLTIRSRSYDFDQWLLLVTQERVEEIYIHFWHNIYRVPNCILSSLTLKRLHLYGVIVEPMNFPCILPNVVSLCFECVGFGPINLLDCAIDVPVLENLSFLRCQNMFHFDVTTPKLRSLTIKSSTSDVLGKFLPDNLDLRSSSTLDLEGSLLKFVKEFSRMRSRLNVEYLKLSGFYRESDVTTSALVHLLRLFPKLCKLDIDLAQLDSRSPERVKTLLKLLEKLHDVAQTNKMLHTLRLISFRGLQSHVIFIKGILARFPALEKIVIVIDEYFCKKVCTGIIQHELLDFPVASTKAKIIVV